MSDKSRNLFGSFRTSGTFPAFSHVFGEHLRIPAFMSWGFYLVKEALEANGRIMQTKGCYMKLEEDCLVIRQPQRNEHYEVCRIFLQGNGKNRRRKP